MLNAGWDDGIEHLAHFYETYPEHFVDDSILRAK
jgi:hypothetical protein